MVFYASQSSNNHQAQAIIQWFALMKGEPTLDLLSIITADGTVDGNELALLPTHTQYLTKCAPAPPTPHTHTHTH